MKAMVASLRCSLRLHFRNRMALVYGFLFPVVFLIAFWVLYRHDRVPLVRHMGELLTVSILGGACFGLPTTLVSERERGVWRRYRLTPVAPAALIAATLIARYALLVLAGLLQLGLALALGMPFPAHPVELFVAFTFAAFAFIGLGLVIATLANNVPAVQALGQCVFLPMLIIGGVAVPLTALPEWAQQVSAFFPGRYAVEAIQTTVNGTGLRSEGFALAALAGLGVVASLAGLRLFRWDAQQSFRSLSGKPWLFLVILGWAGVGIAAELQDRTRPRPDDVPPPAAPPTVAPSPPSPPAETPNPAPEPDRPAAPSPSSEPAAQPAATPDGPAADGTPRTWRDIQPSHLQAIRYFGVPPDHGVVAPYADPSEQPDDFIVEELDTLRANLPHWAPGFVDDPVQRVRNLLYVAAVPDAIQLPVERYVPALVLETLEARVPKEDLIRILAYITLYPLDGDTTAVTRVNELGLEDAVQTDVVRERAYYYAIKYILRLSPR